MIQKILIMVTAMVTNLINRFTKGLVSIVNTTNGLVA